MNPPLPALAREALVSRLRAAGCVFAEEETDLLLAEASDQGQLADLVEQRVAGRPLEQLLGWAKFAGLRVRVDPGVFVPRRRTELLVREAVARLAPGGLVVDLCCGSGAVGLAIARAVEDVELHAVDLDEAAVRCAARNLAAVGGTVHLGDLFAPLPTRLRGRVDVVVACAPYVPSDAVAFMPAEARDHEPRTALDGGANGLEVVDRIAAEAAGWLGTDGQLVLETGEAQVASATSILQVRGLEVVVARDAAIGATIVVGTAATGTPPPV